MSSPSQIADDLAPTGVLRAVVNLGNPVLAAGSPEQPTGVSVDLAHEIARRLGLDVRLVCVDAARLSVEALHTGIADLGFLAIEPARETELAFTPAYVVIEGVYVVPDGSPVRSPADVDRPGVRVGVKRGSAYDLFLTRTLASAEVVRGDEGVDRYVDEKLEGGAGIRQPTTAWVETHPGHRLVEPAFMQIRQAVAVPVGRAAATVDFLRDLVVELTASGFVAEALARGGQDPALVASASAAGAPGS